jgi:hypothetical protein
MKLLWRVGLVILFQFIIFNAGAAERIALVIGNASYAQLGTLNNPKKDATQVEHELASLGFSTKLIIDVNEQSLRRELRAFSARSESASLALVYYAGHGAQINGDNYILPVDLDAPNRESDIQLSAIKVDDLLTSLRSPVKIVFLDACRDNPVLFKNLSKGRGASYARGLAAPKDAPSSNETSGGGVFIGYATDAGSVADDGSGKNSPFTEALLRHIGKPVSIDDMFSMVTRDVRQATSNKQRPYKYASMEQIICLTPFCGGAINDVRKNTISLEKALPSQEASPAPTDSEIQLALSENNFERLKEISEKISNTSTGISLIKSTEELRSLFTEDWVAIDGTVDGKFYYYYQPSSLRHGGGRTWVNMKVAIKGPIATANKLLPKFSGDSVQGPNLTGMHIQVIDCKAKRFGFSYTEQYDENGAIKDSFTAGDPRIVDLPLEIIERSILDSTHGLVCPPKNAGRIVSAKELGDPDRWKSVVSLGDNGMIYMLKDSIKRSGDTATAVINTRFLKEGAFPMYSYKMTVARAIVNCKNGEYADMDADFIDASGGLVGKLFLYNSMKWIVPVPQSPVLMVQKTLCLL